ncbi:unnamed protein product [Heligmosomoides polygyrus]|uniref:Uncharacterized protein n=1 Tax=Heligmosomoides polygyrus TaxID=6339 RepID=A0A183F855_HELPZ|nr:unnamed protein product [Heligmosomoides polygyrus]
MGFRHYDSDNPPQSTAGRYTVPFLKPERWYGLSFTSENKVNMETNLHRESRLIKTASRELVKTSPDQLYEVLMHRNMDGEESAEQLYVTSRWTEEERIPAAELHVSVDVHCESSLTTEHMLLHADEDSVTIEISVSSMLSEENGAKRRLLGRLAGSCPTLL